MAFTGNKFEFRMVGSSQSVSGPNIAINTIVAQELREFADVLEKSDNFQEDLQVLLKKVFTEHSRILFNGNGYGEEWIKEATEVRGLSNLRTTPDAMPHLLDEKNVAMLTKHKVFTKTELFEQIWGMQAVGSDTATVTVHIKKIREKIEYDSGKPQYIETIWGVGYRFKV